MKVLYYNYLDWICHCLFCPQCKKVVVELNNGKPIGPLPNVCPRCGCELDYSDFKKNKDSSITDKGEEWKDVISYGTCQYAVSNRGRFKMKARFNYRGRIIPEHLLTPVPRQNGKTFVNTVIVRDKDGKRRKKKMARLVAEAFLPHGNRENRVRHKSSKLLDDDVNNLEWY